MLRLVIGDQDPLAIERGRAAAAAEIVAGYERAIAALDPSDSHEITWHQERLDDARSWHRHLAS